MTAPYTRNWSANELSDLVGRNYHIEVKGEVETRASNLVPKLRLHTPQGFNPRILMLDLTIETDGELGGQVVMLRKAAYTRPTSGNAYDEVDILFEGQIIERIKVGHPKTLAAPQKKTAKKVSPQGREEIAGEKEEGEEETSAEIEKEKARAGRRRSWRPEAHAVKFTQSAH